MTYGDAQGFREDAWYRGESTFRDSGGLGSDPTAGAYQSGAYGYQSGGGDASAGSVARRPVDPELRDVFDDPTVGERGKDRMLVHVVWEILLLVAVGAAGFVLYTRHRSSVTGANLHDLLVSATALGLLAVGAALSLRAAVANLAIGPIAAASGYFFSTHVDRGLSATAGVTALLALGAGVVIAVVAVGLHVPAWAASLGGAFAVIAWVQAHARAASIHTTYDPHRQAVYWFAGFAALSVLGGILGAVKPLRRAIGRYRPLADPAIRRGGAAGSLAFAAIVSSCVLAGVAGMLFALQAQGAAPSDGLPWTGLALGAALLGGASAYGRRGGLFGTVLAVALIVLVTRYAELRPWKISPYAVAAVTIGAGLIVTRLVEAFGRPRALIDLADDGEDTDWRPEGDGAWSGPQPSWTSQLPVRTVEDTWGGATDERWTSR